MGELKSWQTCQSKTLFLCTTLEDQISESEADVMQLTILELRSSPCFLFQELIQNAEDAGATEVKFLYDKHSYGTKKLLRKALHGFRCVLLTMGFDINVLLFPFSSYLFNIVRWYVLMPW